MQDKEKALDTTVADPQPEDQTSSQKTSQDSQYRSARTSRDKEKKGICMQDKEKALDTTVADPQPEDQTSSQKTSQETSTSAHDQAGSSFATSEFEREITPEELRKVLEAAASEEARGNGARSRQDLVKVADDQEDNDGSRYRKNHRNRHRNKNRQQDIRGQKARSNAPDQSQSSRPATTKAASDQNNSSVQNSKQDNGAADGRLSGQVLMDDQAQESRNASGNVKRRRSFFGFKSPSPASSKPETEPKGSAKPASENQDQPEKLDTIFEEVDDQHLEETIAKEIASEPKPEPYIKPMDDSGFDPYEGDEYRTPIPGTNPAHLSRAARKNNAAQKTSQTPASQPETSRMSEPANPALQPASQNSAGSQSGQTPEQPAASKSQRSSRKRKRSWLDYENNRSQGAYGPMDDWIGNPSWEGKNGTQPAGHPEIRMDRPLEMDDQSKAQNHAQKEASTAYPGSGSPETDGTDGGAETEKPSSLRSSAANQNPASAAPASGASDLDELARSELLADNAAAIHVDQAAEGYIEAEALAQSPDMPDMDEHSTNAAEGLIPSAHTASTEKNLAAHPGNPGQKSRSRKNRKQRRAQSQPDHNPNGQEVTLEELAAAGIDLSQAQDQNGQPRNSNPNRKKKKRKGKIGGSNTTHHPKPETILEGESKVTDEQAQDQMPASDQNGPKRKQNRNENTSAKNRGQSQSGQPEQALTEPIEEFDQEGEGNFSEEKAIPSWKKLKEAAERAYQKEKEEVERMEADQSEAEKLARTHHGGPDGNGPDDGDGSGETEEAVKVPFKDRAKLFIRKALLRPGTYCMIIAAIGILWIVIRMARLGLFTFSLIALVFGIGLAGLAVAGFWFFYTIHKLWRIPALLVCIGLVAGCFYVQQDLNLVSDTMAKITEPADSYVQNVGLYAPSLIPVNKLENVNGEKIGIIGGRDETAVHSLLVSLADKGIYVHVKSFDNLQQLYKAVRGQAVRAVILEAGDVRLIQEFSGSQTGEQSLSLVYSMPVDTKVTSPRSDLNMEKDPFTILISGSNDPITDPSYRSNLNLLVTVNPSTRQVLTTILPRSLYVTSHCQEALACLAENQPDRLSLVSYHSIEALRETLENVMDTPIQFAVRLNTDKILGLFDQGKAIRFNTGGDYTEVNPETGTVMTGPQVRIQFAVRLNTDKILGLFDQGKAIRFNTGGDYTEVNPETGTVMTGPQVRQYIGNINDLSEEDIDQELRQLHALITLTHQKNLISYTNLKGLMKVIQDSIWTSMDYNQVTQLLRMFFLFPEQMNESFSLVTGTSQTLYSMKVIQDSIWTSMDYNQVTQLLRMFFLFPEQMNESFSLVTGTSQTLYSPTLTESTFVTLHDQASLDQAKAGIQTVIQGGTPAVSGLPSPAGATPAAPAADQASSQAAAEGEANTENPDGETQTETPAEPETGGDAADQQPADTANANTPAVQDGTVPASETTEPAATDPQDPNAVAPEGTDGQ